MNFQDIEAMARIIHAPNPLVNLSTAGRFSPALLWSIRIGGVITNMKFTLIAHKLLLLNGAMKLVFYARVEMRLQMKYTEAQLKINEANRKPPV